MTGVLNVIAARGASPFRGFTGGLTADFAVSPGTATATTALQTDGSVTHATSSQPGTFLNWYLPNTGGIGSSFWVRATIISGTFTSGTAGSWLQLNAARTWTRNQLVVGAASVQFTLELASDAAGANIVATCTCTLTATVDA